MKTKIIFGIFAIFFTLTFCRKEHYTAYASTGVITGPDVRMCVCCGGWFIQIDSTTYEFNTLPENSKISLDAETFPLYVKLNWKLATTGACTANRIIITGIRKEQSGI